MAQMFTGISDLVAMGTFSNTGLNA